MIPLAFVLTVVAVAAIACAAHLHLVRKRAGFDRQLRRQVVVHLAGGETRSGEVSLAGVLVESFIDSIVLAQPTWLGPAEPASLGGQVLVPRDQIVFIQLDPPAAG